MTGIATLWVPATVAATAKAPASINVPRDFPTIQAAADAAPAGAAIHIAPGTYTEQIVVNKDLDLRGAGAGSTIKSPSTLVPFGLNLHGGVPVAAIVRVGHAAHVRISDLAVSGPLPCGLATGVIAIQGATLDLSDARVSDIMPAAADCPGPVGGRAIPTGCHRSSRSTVRPVATRSAASHTSRSTASSRTA
jgi:hypothetical protein